MIDGFVADGARVALLWKMAGDAVPVGRASPSAAAVGSGLGVLVALEAGFLFVAYGALGAIPGRMEPVGASTPCHGVRVRRFPAVAVDAKRFLFGVARCAKLRVHLVLVSMGALPCRIDVVNQPRACAEPRLDIRANFSVAGGAVRQFRRSFLVAVHAKTH